MFIDDKNIHVDYIVYHPRCQNNRIRNTVNDIINWFLNFSDECRRLTIVNIVNPARFKRFPRSRTSVNGEMCGLIPCKTNKYSNLWIDLIG